MKKILINISNGFSLRFLCHSEILKSLRENKELEIYILSNNAQSTKDNLGFDDVKYLEYDEKRIQKYKVSSKLYNFLETLRLFTHGGKYKTPEIVFGYTKLNKIKKKIFRIILLALRKSKFLRKILLFFHSYYYPDELYNLVKEINPNLIVTSSLGVFSCDEYILRIARKLNIKSCSCILSWDNSTTRGYPGALPDMIYSWTDIMKEELINFSDCNRNIITTAGVPHFDNYYYNNDADLDKNFYKKYDIDKSKKILFFVTKGPSTFQFNPNIAMLISKNINNGKIKNAHLITRIHPLFYKLSDDTNEYEFSSALKVFKELEKRYDCLSVDYPNITSMKQNFEMNKNEQSHLKNLIVKSDVIINVYSTLNIEGAIFDKPLINIDFDDFEPMYKWNKKLERQSLSIDRALDHNTRIMNYNAISNVINEEELIKKINQYLENPSYKSKGRAIVSEREAGPNKGLSGRFISKHIISLL